MQFVNKNKFSHEYFPPFVPYPIDLTSKFMESAVKDNRHSLRNINLDSC